MSRVHPKLLSQGGVSGAIRNAIPSSLVSLASGRPPDLSSSGSSLGKASSANSVCKAGSRLALFVGGRSGRGGLPEAADDKAPRNERAAKPAPHSPKTPKATDKGLECHYGLFGLGDDGKKAAAQPSASGGHAVATEGQEGGGIDTSTPEASCAAAAGLVAKVAEGGAGGDSRQSTGSMLRNLTAELKRNKEKADEDLRDLAAKDNAQAQAQLLHELRELRRQQQESVRMIEALRSERTSWQDSYAERVEATLAKAVALMETSARKAPVPRCAPLAQPANVGSGVTATHGGGARDDGVPGDAQH